MAERRLRQRGRLRWRRDVVLALVALALVCPCLFAWPVSQPAAVAPVAPVARVVVQRGDTLWGIAREYGPAREDLRSVVYGIKQANQLHASLIHPGDVLLVPQDGVGAQSVCLVPMAWAQSDSVGRGSDAR